MKLFALFIAGFAAIGVYAQETPQPAFEFLSRFPHIRDFTISEDQDEAFFTVQSPNEEIAVIACMKQQEGKWLEYEIVPFTGQYRDIEPFLAPDGLRLYFSSDRPLKDGVEVPKDYDIWYVERKDAGSSWSAPVNLGAPVNTSGNEFYPSLSTNGNLYFTSDAMTMLSKDDIYCSKWEGGKYTAPVPLDKAVNSAGYEFNAYISPGEDFLIYTAYGRKEGFGSGDLYISQKDAKGNWKEAMNMGEKINSAAMDYCPFYDVKTNTLYFTSKRSAIVPGQFMSMKDFLKIADQYENGLSRIYKVTWKGV